MRKIIGGSSDEAGMVEVSVGGGSLEWGGSLYFSSDEKVELMGIDKFWEVGGWFGG